MTLPATPDVTSYVYDPVGNLDTVTYSNGLIHDYDYDSLNRLEELYHWGELKVERYNSPRVRRDSTNRQVRNGRVSRDIGSCIRQPCRLVFFQSR